MKRYVTLVIEFDADEEYPKLRDIDVELFTGGKVIVFSNVNLLEKKVKYEVIEGLTDEEIEELPNNRLIDQYLPIGGCKNCED